MWQRWHMLKSRAAPLGLSGFALLGLLAGCDESLRESLKPVERPAGLAPKPAPAPYQPSARSRELSAYYLQLEQHLLAQGLLRRDGGGPDTAFDAEDLAENFEAIAFYDEHSGGNLSADARRAQSAFHPWRGPVRVASIHGPSVSTEQRRADDRAVAKYLARLSRVTGHAITPAASSRANFHVLFMGADDDAALKAAVRRAWPGFPQSRLSALTRLPKDIYCLVHTNLPSAPRGQERAIALIRAEHPDLMRLSCIHEELAQGLGLSNDSPYARPSIFNDDEEFATLTTHDELLLKMLYDPRLGSGISLAEARPLLPRIAAELTGEQGS